MNFLDPSLVLYLPLGKRDGDSFISEDRYGHLATVTGATWGLQGRTFYGTDDNIVTNAPYATLFAADALYLAAWVKWTAIPTTNQTFFESTSANCIGVGGGWASGKWAVYLYTTGWILAQEATATIDTNWHFVEVSYDKVNLKMFVDLVEKASTAETGNAQRDGNVRLGEAAAGTGDYNGMIGEVFGYNPIPTLARRTLNYLATKWRYV